MALKENYKDDILDVSVNTKRKYRMTENADGTVSFDDETVYTQEGDSFGASDMNAVGAKVNELDTELDTVNDNLSGFKFYPTETGIVGLIADDSYYLNEDNKYVLADSTTGQALITSEPTTYKALASDTDLYGIEGEDTVSGFEPSMTPITEGGQTLSTLDEKINYMLGKLIAEERYAFRQMPYTRTLNGNVSQGYCELAIKNNSQKAIAWSENIDISNFSKMHIEWDGYRYNTSTAYATDNYVGLVPAGTTIDYDVTFTKRFWNNTYDTFTRRVEEIDISDLTGEYVIVALVLGHMTNSGDGWDGLRIHNLWFD